MSGYRVVIEPSTSRPQSSRQFNSATTLRVRVEEGRVDVLLDPEAPEEDVFALNVGDSIDIPPQTWYSLQAVVPSTVILTRND